MSTIVSEMYHPPIGIGGLKAVLAALEGMSTYSVTEYLYQSPYDEATRGLLKELFVRIENMDIDKLSSEVNADLMDENGEIDTLKSLKKIQRDMQAFQLTLGKDDSKEKLQYFNTMVRLSDKLLELMEKATNIKQYKQFKEVVLSGISEFMTNDQKTQLLERLKSLQLV